MSWFDSIMGSAGKKLELPSADEALPGRSTPIEVAERHFVLEAPLRPPFGDGQEVGVFALGCFWGAERVFWQREGVRSTSVGYIAGHTPHPTYEEVCSGRTGHTEAVQVAFDPSIVSFDDLLRLFWESHDPTQGMRQGNDSGTQYRSGIYSTSASQQAAAESSRDQYQAELARAGHGEITTEILPAGEFYYAEDYHQQYLAKNPGGYCGIGGTGVTCPIGLTTRALDPSSETDTLPGAQE